MVVKHFYIKSTSSGISSLSNQQLANELHKPVTRKFKLRKVFLKL